jgi:hypothetical protein
MRRAIQATWPFTYETDAAFIAATIARYEAALGVERRCVGRWLRAGIKPPLDIHRRNIDRIEAARRAGLTRLRALAEASEGAAPHRAEAAQARAA